MQIPKIGWLEIDDTSSPLRFYPLKTKEAYLKKESINVTLGRGFRAWIKVQTTPPPKHQPNLLPVRTKKTAQGNYQFGPFIAILTSHSRHPFAGNHRNFADLMEMGKRMGVIVYVLTPKGIQAGKSHVTGYLLQQARPVPRFYPATLPLPNVIYNRIPYRHEEQSEDMQATITYLNQHKKIPMFNPHFFNKWTLYRNLTPSSCQKYLPVTRKMADFATFREMVLKFSTIFLKPIEGKAGIGMMKIEGKGPFILTYQTKQQKQRLSIRDLQQLYQQVKSWIGNQAYLIQQGVALATYQGRPFDIRMLVQKNNTGNWNVSGIGVRVAGEKAISTHVPMGGRIENLDHVLTSTFPHQKNSLRQQLVRLGLQFAQEIERKIGAKHGEMSMDIGIDHRGKLWFFEANAKPQKFDEPIIREQSLRRILDYSLYLSGFYSPRQRVRSS